MREIRKIRTTLAMMDEDERDEDEKGDDGRSREKLRRTMRLAG